jgi:hypothetical protein
MASVTGLVSPALPPPLVKFSRHPVRWVENKVVLTVDAVVLAHVGVLIVGRPVLPDHSDQPHP